MSFHCKKERMSLSAHLKIAFDKTNKFGQWSGWIPPQTRHPQTSGIGVAAGCHYLCLTSRRQFLCQTFRVLCPVCPYRIQKVWLLQRFLWAFLILVFVPFNKKKSLSFLACLSSRKAKLEWENPHPKGKLSDIRWPLVPLSFFFLPSSIQVRGGRGGDSPNKADSLLVLAQVLSNFVTVLGLYSTPWGAILWIVTVVTSLICAHLVSLTPL